MYRVELVVEIDGILRIVPVVYVGEETSDKLKKYIGKNSNDISFNVKSVEEHC